VNYLLNETLKLNQFTSHQRRSPSYCLNLTLSFTDNFKCLTSVFGLLLFSQLLLLLLLPILIIVIIVVGIIIVIIIIGIHSFTKIDCLLEIRLCRYRSTGLPSDKRAFKAACNAARTSIMKSRADHIKTQLQQASGDIRATWRTAQSLLHSRQKVIYDDMECADLVGKFSSFFVDKSDTSGTTSRRRYSSPAPGCSLHDRIPVRSYPILKKTGLDRSTPGRYLTYRQSPGCSRDLCWHVCVPTSQTPRTSASGSRHTGKDIRPRRRCSTSLTASTLRLTARKSHCL